MEQHAHPHRADMLSVEEALEKVLALVEQLPSEETPLLEADGQTLAEEVRALFDVPALANSAMDGYAVQTSALKNASTETPVTLQVTGQVQAGQLARTPVTPSTVVRIMTGAPLPEGADAVVPYELTDESQRLAAGRELSEVALYQRPQRGENVRPAGEDVRRGSVVLKQGQVLDPPAIGMLASLGYARACVIRRPQVAILATGDEVQSPGEALEPGRLFDINSYTVASAVRRYGGVPHLLGTAKDEIAELRDKLRQGLQADMLITSAGVSAGAFDIVKDALAELGNISFWAVRMRPSRPLAFGALNAPDGRRVPHLGLPGNPVSALVALVEFGRPALAKMMGKTPTPLPTVEAVLEAPISNSDGRRSFARVTLEGRKGILYARPTSAQGSNVLTSLVLAQGLAICPEDLAGLPAGQRVSVQLLDWLDHSILLPFINHSTR